METQSLFEQAEMTLEENDYRRSGELGEDFRKLRVMLAEWQETRLLVARMLCQ